MQNKLISPMKGNAHIIYVYLHNKKIGRKGIKNIL